MARFIRSQTLTLLGRERNREGATVLQGNPEEVRELIDATPFAKKYTSGVLSFA
ncbi:hypothetical protein ACSLOE_30555, partial [Escherichia coli]|uniref:hypothetical protein n=1 Tax=Escherichia coli TaxID=562 RepID=UPI003EE3E09D